MFDCTCKCAIEFSFLSTHSHVSDIQFSALFLTNEFNDRQHLSKSTRTSENTLTRTIVCIENMQSLQLSCNGGDLTSQALPILFCVRKLTSTKNRPSKINSFTVCHRYFITESIPNTVDEHFNCALRHFVSSILLRFHQNGKKWKNSTNKSSSKACFWNNPNQILVCERCVQTIQSE